MMRVESINPTTINAVCALRRGILRVPSLKMTGLRQATHATVRRQRPIVAISTIMMVFIGIPKTSFMVSSRLSEPRVSAAIGRLCQSFAHRASSLVAPMRRHGE